MCVGKLLAGAEIVHEQDAVGASTRSALAKNRIGAGFRIAVRSVSQDEPALSASPPILKRDGSVYPDVEQRRELSTPGDQGAHDHQTCSCSHRNWNEIFDRIFQAQPAYVLLDRIERQTGR